MMLTLTRKMMVVCSVVALCAALVGCSSDNDGKLAELERQLDMEEAARMMAEQERDAAKSAQTTAEQERDTAKSAQTTAEQERDAAKSAQTTAEQERDAAKNELADFHFDARVANVISKVSAPGQPHRCALDTGCGPYGSGTDYSSVSITYDIGYRQHGERPNYAFPWHGDEGQVEFALEIQPEPLQEDPPVWTWTHLWTTQRNDDIEGITISHSPIEDHGLGAGWQGFEAAKEYEGGGTLMVRFFTDLAESDNLAQPYTWELKPPEEEILLNDSRIPDLPDGREGLFFFIPEEGLRGTLDGVAGTFTCPGGYCSLTTSWEGPGYVPWTDSDPVLFTPDGAGQSKSVRPTHLVSPSAEVPKVDYISLGSWLYVPEDDTDLDAFRFGIFAGGDDPFVGANITSLVGTARYTGKATGMYAQTVVAPDVDTFSADVAFMADFRSSGEAGMITGSVSNFELDSGKPSPLSELLLVADDFGGESGNTNISPGWPGHDGSISGGFIGGPAFSNEDWHGGWDAKFYGNDDADPTAHPTSFAGAFGATNGNGHIAGSFGAYKQ